MVDKVHDPVKDICSNLKKAVLAPTSEKEKKFVKFLKPRMVMRVLIPALSTQKSC